MKRLTLLTGMLAVGGVLVFAGSLAAQTSAPVVSAAAQRAQQAPPPVSPPPDMPMQGHQMMGMQPDKTTSEANLQALVAKMNAAKGEAKIDAIAEVLAALVQQQVPKAGGMMPMDGQMMGHMMKMMQSMTESMSPEMKKMMAECPMMKMMTMMGSSKQP
jgi:hypothetical protein